MNKVCIARANSGVENDYFWAGNGYYDEPQNDDNGLTRFGQALIRHTIQKSKQAIWAVENGIPRSDTGSRYWVRRISNAGDWIIYDIFVDLNDKDYVFWTLKNGK